MIDPTIALGAVVCYAVGALHGWLYANIQDRRNDFRKVVGAPLGSVGSAGSVAHGTAASTFYKEEDGALIVSDPKASFDKAETLTDLLA